MLARFSLLRFLLVAVLGLGLGASGALHARVVPGEALWQAYLLAGGDPGDLCGEGMEQHGGECQWCRADTPALAPLAGLLPGLSQLSVLLEAAAPQQVLNAHRHDPSRHPRAPPAFTDLHLS